MVAETNKKYRTGMRTARDQIYDIYIYIIVTELSKIKLGHGVVAISIIIMMNNLRQQRQDRTIPSVHCSWPWMHVAVPSSCYFF